MVSLEEVLGFPLGIEVHTGSPSSHRQTFRFRRYAILLTLILIAFCSSQPVYAQRPLFARLDTIISLGIVPSNTFQGEITEATYQDGVLIYLPSNEDSDSLKFLRLWKRGFILDTIYATVSGLPERIRDPLVQQMSVNANYAALLFDRTIFLFDWVTPRSLHFIESVTLGEATSFIKLFGDKLLIGRCYEFDPRDAAVPTMLLTYDIRHRTFSKPINPPFRDIELTHFEPRHHIDVSGTTIAFAQTSTYEVALFDTSLRLRQTIGRRVRDWRPFNDAVIVSARAKSLRSRGIIDALDSEEGIASRLESIDFLDDSTLEVRYIPPHGNVFPRSRCFDIWNRRHGRWVLQDSDFVDIAPKGDVPLTKENYPLGSGYGNCQYVVLDRDHLVNAHFVAPVPLLGRSVKQVSKSEDDYVAKSEPTLHIFIYSIPEARH